MRDVVTQRDRAVDGRAGRTQRIATTATGRLDEWLEIGGVRRAASSTERGVLSARDDARTGIRSVWVRADEIR